MLQILYSEEFYDFCSSPDVIKAINQGGCDVGKGGGNYTNRGEKRTVFRILMRTAEVKSRLEDLGLNRTILLK